MADDDKFPKSMVGRVEVTIKGKPYVAQVSAPAPMASLEDLEASLTTNRDILRESMDEFKRVVKQDIFDQLAPWLLDYDSPTLNAIVAHQNINILVPLINMKGGHVSFNKKETMPVQDHIEWMRNMAEKQVLESHMQDQKPFHYATLATILLVIVLVVIAL